MKLKTEEINEAKSWQTSGKTKKTLPLSGLKQNIPHDLPDFKRYYDNPVNNSNNFDNVDELDQFCNSPDMKWVI